VKRRLDLLQAYPLALISAVKLSLMGYRDILAPLWRMDICIEIGSEDSFGSTFSDEHMASISLLRIHIQTARVSRRDFSHLVFDILSPLAEFPKGYAASL
jgi:hypothetical protein